MFCVLSQRYLRSLAKLKKKKIFTRESKSFAREGKSFARERKVSRGNAKVLRENAKFLEGTQKFCERTQSFSRERKSFARERKTFEKYFFLPPWIFFHSPQIFPTTMSLKGLRKLMIYIKKKKKKKKKKKEIRKMPSFLSNNNKKKYIYIYNCINDSTKLFLLTQIFSFWFSCCLTRVTYRTCPSSVWKTVGAVVFSVFSLQTPPEQALYPSPSRDHGPTSDVSL